MIAVYRDHSGWTLRQNEDKLGYYSSLPEVMSVAYSKEREADSHGKAKQGDMFSDDRRPP